ncbi:L,D-transpeptidase family protein [Actinacidiphila acididurans]|uniref:L,D-transpeptidase family protein n=1 Tax=Actinacidiphila acididurans TaxID=2784346 RepID=UPI001F2879F7|nr:L,D-transpeptidase family protein [Actinacidiphila acididurans]
MTAAALPDKVLTEPRDDDDRDGGDDREVRDEADDPNGRGRHRRPRRTRRRTAAFAAAGALGLVALGAGYAVAGRHSGDAASAKDAEHTPPDQASHAASVAQPAPAHTNDALPTVIPGIGPKTLAAIPATTRQVLVASGRSANSSLTTVTLWSRTDDGHWKAGQAWPAHNALHGWTRDHQAGDLHSPIGVFTLSDAGGFESDPGSALPYHHSSKFRAGGVGFDGEPLDEAFDYVIAIDYNRVPGTSPLDGTQPLGPSRGGGIWVHVDHGGPTHGCVSISAAHMVQLLRTLRPADHPVIVMGDSAALAT